MLIIIITTFAYVVMGEGITIAPFCQCVCVSLREHISTINDLTYSSFEHEIGSTLRCILLKNDRNRKAGPEFMTQIPVCVLSVLNRSILGMSSSKVILIEILSTLNSSFTSLPFL